MSDITINLVPPTLPNGYCPDGPNAYQQFANDLIGGTTATISTGNAGYNYGNGIPDPGDQGKPWLRLNGDGTPDRWYVYSGGLWLAKHPSPPSSNERRLWVGAEADLASYDGGAAAAITATTGPFWVVDHAFDFRVPLGPGTSAAPASTVVAVTGTGGEENHTLLLAEMPSHTHSIPIAVKSNIQKSGTSNYIEDAAGFTGATGGDGTGAHATTPHNNMPPYYAAFFIKRTARVYYTP